MKKHIPNLITLLNLLSGVIAVILAVQGDLIGAALFVIIGIIFDFFDGFVARLLGVQGELGKQLDSLADVVTSGVVPGIAMFQMLTYSLNGGHLNHKDFYHVITEVSALPLFGLLIVAAAAYRLANFNIDMRQTSSFIGVPTPASALFVLSFPLILNYGDSEFAISLITNTWFLLAVTILSCYMMNANIPLFGLKFRNFNFQDNWMKYLFLTLSLIMLIVLKVIAIPLIIVSYVLLSIIDNIININKEE